MRATVSANELVQDASLAARGVWCPAERCEAHPQAEADDEWSDIVFWRVKKQEKKKKKNTNTNNNKKKKNTKDTKHTDHGEAPRCVRRLGRAAEMPHLSGRHADIYTWYMFVYAGMDDGP